MGVVRDQVPVFEPERYGYVTDIVVDPAARGSGVGQVLFEALKAWFRERGVSNLELQVAYNNSVSQAFWRAMGCTDYMDTLWYDLEAK
jgi:ribosomal protein S18 acetylase RimI-like enzyme